MHSEFETPILCIIFNRPDLTFQLFEQLRKIKPKYLYVAADGPREKNETDRVNCEKTKTVINTIDWPCELKVLFRENNLGCGLAVSNAISWFFEHVEQGIILEDDCHPDLTFFPFCNELLMKFKDDETIFLISGTNFQNGAKYGNGSYYFSNYPITWGWASWRRAWQKFNHEPLDFKQSFANGLIDHAFQSISEKYFWRTLVRDSIKKKRDVWDHQWFYAIWKNKGVSITPNCNLIVNRGFHNNAVHTFLHDSKREPSFTTSLDFPLIHPEKKIETLADHSLYYNIFSHSLSRIIRLTKENGIIKTINYAISSLIKKG